jgi:hypothetical protein
MRPSPLVRGGRVALVAGATVAAVGLAAPAPTASAGPGARAAATTSIDLHGGDASASVVCGNVADAVAYAQSHGLARQQNDCHPEAVGGDVELHDVQIVIRAEDVHASADNTSLAELAAAGGAATSSATCSSSTASAAKAARNRCWSRATGGRLELRDVVLVSHKAGKQSRKQVRSLFMRGTDGRVGTGCGAQPTPRQDERDDCTARGVGGSIDLRSVDVTAADGSTSADVRVSVRGGDASSSVYCYSWVKAGTSAPRGNTCSATSRGGRATLRHVRVDVYAD